VKLALREDDLVVLTEADRDKVHDIEKDLVMVVDNVNDLL
jgi:hypothetical protein